MKDIIIIGNGPSGLSAALYTSRAGLSTAVIGIDYGALDKAEKVDNYFGLKNPLTGRELLQNGIEQAKRLGAALYTDEVTDVSYTGRFRVTTKNDAFESEAVILTTGASRKKLRISGIEEYEGRGVSYCAVCDGFFYRNKSVAVIGSGEYALHEANELLPIAEQVVLLTNGAPLKADFPEQIKIIETPIARVYGEQTIGGIEFTDGKNIQISGVFIAIGTAAASDIARKLGIELAGNSIIVDDKMRTNIPGLFAAGDCVGGVMQVSVAVGEGTKAALSAIEFIRSKRKDVG